MNMVILQSITHRVFYKTLVILVIFIMITLSKKLKMQTEGCDIGDKSSRIRIFIRDKLLVKEVQEMDQNLPTTCKTKFSNPNLLHEFTMVVTPDEGYWRGGKFVFSISVPEEYNMAPPKVKCLTKLWHPNINENGDICLSLLRQNSIDGLGWAPTRKLKDVIWGVNSLFTDLLNFDDPLNIEAAEMYQKNKEQFRERVRDYVYQYARR